VIEKSFYRSQPDEGMFKLRVDQSLEKGAAADPHSEFDTSLHYSYLVNT